MPTDSGDKSNNDSNKFPNQGNFSASQNNVGKSLNLSNDLQAEKQKNFKDVAQKEAAKKGVETLATAYTGPLGGKAANAIMNTELGDKVVKATSKASKNPILDSTKNMASSLFKKSDNNMQGESNNDSLLNEKSKKKIIMFGIFSSLGCLGFLILVIVVATVMLGPIFYTNLFINNIKDNVSNFWSRMGYFLKGCKNEQECSSKEEESFYKKIESVKNYYKTTYSIDLNMELITATLTYYDPITTLEDLNSEAEDLSDIQSTKAIDFKKSRKKINDLAKHMVGEGAKCVDGLSGNIVATYKEEEKDTPCPESGENENIERIEWRYLDEEKYRKYLEDTFIRKFYFDNKKTDDIDKKISMAINDIYERVEIVKYLNSAGNTGSNYSLNSAQVKVLDKAGNVIDSVSLFEYIQGVMYVEAGLSNPYQYKKAMAVVIKNYLYAKNRATENNIPTTFSIESSTNAQAYCSIKQGCHISSDGVYVPGPNENGEFILTPYDDKVVLEELNQIINETFKEFITDGNGNFVLTQYKTNCTKYSCAKENDMGQEEAIAMAKAGSDYKAILTNFYKGEIKTIIQKLVLPVDANNFYISSEYGRRDYGNGMHNGIDFAIAEQNNIYAVASGVVTEASLGSDTGCHIKIDHGSYSSRYLHLYPINGSCSFEVNVGDNVETGQKIALSGGATPPTGDSTGAHLHFDYFVGAERRNPRELFGDLLPPKR